MTFLRVCVCVCVCDDDLTKGQLFIIVLLGKYIFYLSCKHDRSGSYKINRWGVVFDCNNNLY